MQSIGPYTTVKKMSLRSGAAIYLANFYGSTIGTPDQSCT